MEHYPFSLLGKISAGMTHEMKNVLAIIGQAAGLMSPEPAGMEPPASAERRTRAFESIERQIRRGTDMMSQFNRFAHAMDHERGTISIRQVVDLAVFLMNRFAHQQDVHLIPEPEGPDISVSTQPIRLILTVCGCIDLLLSEIIGPGDIHIGFTAENDTVCIRFVINAAALDREGSGRSVLFFQSMLKSLTDEMDAVIQPVSGSGASGMCVVIPATA